MSVGRGSCRSESSPGLTRWQTRHGVLRTLCPGRLLPIVAQAGGPGAPPYAPARRVSRRPSTPFAPFGDATRGREPPVRAASPGPTHPSGVHARARRPARRTLRACTRGRDGPLALPATPSRPSTPWHRPPGQVCVLGRCVLPGGQVCGLPALCRTPSRRPSGRHTWAGVLVSFQGRVRSPGGFAGASPPKVPEGGSEEPVNEWGTLLKKLPVW
jgi:hypothetical protein